ncbi:YfbK domain-containing protein [Longimicrobium sp.]|uniref:vWA domain-containing protein n=1 Tax=Longimicrobium sp. TaxID=2029185 RepID=UPI003B3B9058
MKQAFVRALFILLALPAARPAAAQEAATVTGRVTNAQGQPEAAVLVRIESLNAGASTAADGMYRLVIPGARIRAGQSVQMTASRQGLAPVSRSITLSPGATLTQDFVMTAQMIFLEDVVVTGTAQTTEVSKVPFAVAHVNAAEVPVSSTTAAGAIQGKVAGVTIVNGTGQPGTAPSILLRGRRSINAEGNTAPNASPGTQPGGFDTEEYSLIQENPFLAVAGNPLSTFGIDVDPASYSNVRRFIRDGRAPPRDAVRIEEMVNYFDYAYPDPRGRHPFAVVTEVGVAPWNPRHRLVHVGIQGRRMPRTDLPASNLVFLVDVSGSMQSPDKLPLVKASLRLLVEELSARDRVAIVVYAGAAGLVLDATPGDRRETILDAIERLEAGGSTAGAAGIRLAYEVARRNHVAGGNNRVILTTDGDFNVGTSSESELVQLIEEKRAQGTFLTVLGYGTGNLADARMEQMADHGNGNYAYIDGLMEARKVLVQEMGGTLFTIAKDVKLQVEFNPAQVRAYRLIGYENRLLRAEDFNDDRKDAGELGAGHSVTALYEVVPVDADSDVQVGNVDPLRYQSPATEPVVAFAGEMMNVNIRYKQPDGEQSVLLSHPVRAPRRLDRPSDDFRFAAAVAEFGMLLRDSEHRGRASLEDVLSLASGALGSDPSEHRAGFVRMVQDFARLPRAEAAVAAGR